VSSEWEQKVGRGTSVKWPVGLGGKGNEGVAGQIKNTPGALGYVELAYAIKNNLPAAAIRNQAGKFVEPTIRSTTAAAAVAGAEAPILPPLVGARRVRRRFGDRGFRELTRGAALTLVVMVAGMAAVMAHAAWPSIRRFGWSFIVKSDWDPVAEHFGALPFIFGTLVSSLLALLIAVPLGIGAAIYLAELAPRGVRPPVTFLVELLAAVPSVVYGLWAIFVLAPWLRTWVQRALGHTLGF